MLEKKLKRITFCTTSFASYDRRMIRIIQTLLDDGYEVKWVSRKYDNSPNGMDIDHIFIDTFFKNGILFYLEYNIRLIAALKNINQPGLISSVDLDTILGVSIFSRLSRSRFIFDSHEYFSEVPELSGKPLKKWVWKRIGKWCIPNAIDQYTVGEALASRLSDDYNVVFKVVRNIGNMNEQDVVTDPKIGPSENKILIYLGVLNEGRGLESLISSLKYLPETYNLHLIGEGDIGKELRKQVVQEGLSKRVVFKGMIAPANLKQHLNVGYIAFNLLTDNSLSYYYSLANKYFDYIHNGLPVITMNFPEYQLLNSQFKTAVLIDNIEPLTIAEAIKQIEDPQIYAQLQTNCKIASQTLNWSNEQEKLRSIYKQINATV